MLYTTNILLTRTSIINFFAAVVVILIGVMVYVHNKKNPAHQLFLLVCVFLGFWALSSTLADVMHAPRPALFWARMAILGPFYFPAYFLIFTHYFPRPSGKMTTLKAGLIMVPSVVITLLTTTPLNVVEVRLEGWGTDFTPGILYTLGLPYIFGYLGLAAANLWRSHKRTKDKVVRKQAGFVFAGISLVVVSLVLTNAILPLVFHYGKASVFGPAASLIFAMCTGYALIRHGLLKVRIIATELFAISLLLVNFIPVFSGGSYASALYQMGVFFVTLVFVVLLIKSMHAEEQRQEELKKLTGKLAEANTQLEALDEAKSEFISIASHQLRTPASVLKGYLSLLMEGAYGEITPTIKEKLDQMYSMNERLIHLINNILNMSRIEKGRLEFICSYVDVVSIVDEVVTELMSKARDKKLELRFVKPAAELQRAYVDGDKLHEIVVNLIENAVKYTVKGSVTVMVDIRPGVEGDEVIISVSDSGVGMTEEDTKRMFEKFYRAKGAIGVSRESGTGLGLYICAKFLDNMGGRIWIDKTLPGKGTTFAVALPVKPQQRCVRPQ